MNWFLRHMDRRPFWVGRALMLAYIVVVFSLLIKEHA